MTKVEALRAEVSVSDEQERQTAALPMTVTPMFIQVYGTLKARTTHLPDSRRAFATSAFDRLKAPCNR